MRNESLPFPTEPMHTLRSKTLRNFLSNFPRRLTLFTFPAETEDFRPIFTHHCSSGRIVGYDVRVACQLPAYSRHSKAIPRTEDSHVPIDVPINVPIESDDYPICPQCGHVGFSECFAVGVNGCRAIPRIDPFDCSVWFVCDKLIEIFE